MQMRERLKEKIYEVVKKIETGDIGIAFSGGVDSSLLAKVCKDSGKNITLLTVSFHNSSDVEVSKEVARELGLPIIYETINLEALEQGLKKVLAIIEFDRIARLDTCLAFYHVFKLASEHGVKTVLSANGADELFCGYSLYKNVLGDGPAIVDRMKTLVETAKKDKTETDKIAKLFNVAYFCPFLSEDFTQFSMTVPLEYKMRSEDILRKLILREVAIDVGVHSSAASRPKKAFQYSSGVHKSIVKLAKKRGFTKKEARAAGFESEMEAYISSLKKFRK